MLPHTTRLKLGTNSPLASAGSSEMQLLFIVSHGLQILRTKSISPLARDLFNSNVLDTGEFFKRFSEPMIQSVFFRATLADEWCKDFDTIGIKNIDKQINEGESDNLLGELVVFLEKSNRKNLLSSSILSRVNTDEPDDSVIIDMIFNGLIKH